MFLIIVCNDVDLRCLKMMKTVVMCVFGLVLSISLKAQTYQFYYGNLHAHSSYSDGNDDSATAIPWNNYQYAKTAANFHFLGISEHNHSQAGMQRPNYANGLRQADSANADGSFIAMYGMEWGVISAGGHVLVYGYDSLIGWEPGNYDVFVDKPDYNGLFTKIARKPGAFATLAHPDATDFSGLMQNPVNATWDSAVVGMAIRSGPAFSTNKTYSNPSTSSFESRYKDALKQGYHIGATIDHDNHNTTFGRTAASRTVVLAPSLTRANIMEAFRQRRTQASDDWNVQVTFKVGGRHLGSIYTDTANPVITVSVVDPDLESTSSIIIVRGIAGNGISPPNYRTFSSTSNVSFTDTITTGLEYYYYCVVVQADNNRIFTAPVWVTKLAPVPVELVKFEATRTAEGALISWATASEKDADYFELEKGEDPEAMKSIHRIRATNTQKLTQYLYKDVEATDRLTYYRLRQVDYDGTVHYSKVIWLRMLHPEQNPAVNVFPNPFAEALHVEFNEQPQVPLTFKLTDSMGQQVWEESFTESYGSEWHIPIPGAVKPGLYSLEITTPSGSQFRKVMKQ